MEVVRKIKSNYFINLYKYYDEKYYAKQNKEKFLQYVLQNHNKMDRKVDYDKYATSGGT